MKNFAKFSLILVTVAGLAGFSLAELREYGQVAQNRTHESIKKMIPLDVEIDRMEVILQKLDRQVATQKYAVAKSQVALENAEGQLALKQTECESLVAEMRQLRDLQQASRDQEIQLGCHKISTTQVNQALSYKVANWKEVTMARDAHVNAVEQQRVAHQKLNQQFEKWQHERQLLSHRLETLRSRYQAQKLAGKPSTQSIRQGDLSRAVELAEQIDTELRVLEAQRVLSGELIPIQTELDQQNLDEELDAILGTPITNR